VLRIWRSVLGLDKRTVIEAIAEADDDAEVTLQLTLWGNEDRAGRYVESVELFEEAHPNISVSVAFTDWSGYWPARSTEAAGRSLPDVMQFDMAYLREYGENGHLLDLNPYIGDQIDLSGFDDALVESVVLDGQQLGIPVSTNTLATFFNPRALEAAGVDLPDEDYTWEDYNDFIRAVSEAGATNDDGEPIYGSEDYTRQMWFFLQWAVQQGIEPFQADGTLGFDEDHVREFLNLTADLREEGLVLPADRIVQLDPMSGFGAQETSSQVIWDNFLAVYIADTGEEEFEMLPVPSGDDGEKAQFFRPSMLLSAAANTEHPEEAALLINFLLTDLEVAEIFGTNVGVRADAGQRESLQDLERADAMVHEYEEHVADSGYATATAPLPVRGFGTIEAEWLRLSEELNFGTITVDDFISTWFAEAEIAIQE
jgi:multiple sugar transport system substrate-binding protein